MLRGGNPSLISVWRGGNALELCTLASGSSGNCALVSGGGVHILMDAGISARRISQGLKALGLTPEDLSCILITHEHSDHISGLTTLLKHHRIPVYATAATGRQLAYRIAWVADNLRTVQPGVGFAAGGLEVRAFATPHDAADSVGYTVTEERRKLAFATDLGHVTQEVLSAVAGAQLAVLETNYDPEWLQSGPYPEYLKERIMGGNGHLSNEDGGQLALALSQLGVRQLVLAHLSKENNTPARALETVCASLIHGGVQPQKDVRVEVAPRDRLGPVYRL